MSDDGQSFTGRRAAWDVGGVGEVEVVGPAPPAGADALALARTHPGHLIDRADPGRRPGRRRGCVPRRPRGQAMGQAPGAHVLAHTRQRPRASKIFGSPELKPLVDAMTIDIADRDVTLRGAIVSGVPWRASIDGALVDVAGRLSMQVPEDAMRAPRRRVGHGERLELRSSRDRSRSSAGLPAYLQGRWRSHRRSRWCTRARAGSSALRLLTVDTVPSGPHRVAGPRRRVERYLVAADEQRRRGPAPPSVSTVQTRDAGRCGASRRSHRSTAQVRGAAVLVEPWPGQSRHGGGVIGGSPLLGTRDHRVQAFVDREPCLVEDLDSRRRGMPSERQRLRRPTGDELAASVTLPCPVRSGAPAGHRPNATPHQEQGLLGHRE